MKNTNDLPSLELRYKIAKFLETSYNKIRRMILPTLVFLLITYPVFA